MLMFGWIWFAPIAHAQNEIGDLTADQLTDQAFNSLNDLRSQVQFRFHRFDWMEWQSLGLFPDLVLNGIQERVKRLGEMEHWLELQSVAGMDTLLIAQLLHQAPELVAHKHGVALKEQEVSLQSVNRIQFPYLNRYSSNDSTKIPEGSPWLQRIRVNWRSSSLLVRLAVEKDMGEPLTPIDHYSWTIHKAWAGKGYNFELTIGQFRPFFGIGYLHGLRGGRINAITGGWTEAHDLKIKPMSAITENFHPQGVAFQIRKGNWTMSSFFSVRKFPFTDSSKIDLLNELLWTIKPQLAGLRRTEAEKKDNWDEEIWSSINLLYQKRTWAFGLMLSSENWNQPAMLTKSWVSLSSYLRKSYSGGHFQTELLSNSIRQIGIKMDWIQWFGNHGTLQLKSQNQLASPKLEELAKLVQWRNPTVNEQFIQLIGQWKIGRSYHLFQQVWKEWKATPGSENAGFGLGLQWQGGKTEQMIAEFRWTKAVSNLIYQAQWLISKGQRIKTVWRISPSNASIASSIQYALNPAMARYRLQIQFSGFNLQKGILPLLEPDLEFPIRMQMASGSGSRWLILGKYKFPPYLTLGISCSMTHKTGRNPWGEGLDARKGNFLYEIGFSLEIRLKDKTDSPR